MLHSDWEGGKWPEENEKKKKKKGKVDLCELRVQQRLKNHYLFYISEKEHSDADNGIADIKYIAHRGFIGELWSELAGPFSFIGYYFG